MKKFTISPRIQFLIVMCGFGLLGPIVRAINLPSTAVSCLRSWISSIFLFGYVLVKKIKVEEGFLKKHGKHLLIMGVFLALDLLFFFMSYSYTTIATATLCYYIEPLFYVIGCALIFGEKPTVPQFVCVGVALIGMAFVAGIPKYGLPSPKEAKGIIFAVLGGFFYAAVTLANKAYPGIEQHIKIACQLFISAVVLTPYICLTEDVASFSIGLKDVVLLLIIGVVMTGFAYLIYFENAAKLPSKTVAIFSYGDPVVSVFASAVFLKEPIDIYGIMGAIMIIGAALFSELENTKKTKE